MRTIFWKCLLALFVLGVLLFTRYGGSLGIGKRESKQIRQEIPAPPNPLTYDFAVPVLMYHRICDLTPEEARSPLQRDLTVSPADFTEQVRYLVGQGFAIVTVEEVAAAVREGRPLPQRAVALTMDDGYRDNFACALPILRRYRVPATVFLVTAAVGTPGHLTWAESRTMLGQRCGFQSHTVHHYHLTTLPPAELSTELSGAKQSIEAHLPIQVSQLAYPSGAYNTRVTVAARAAGYQIGWKKGGGPVTPGDNPYLLPRIRVRGCTTLEEFKRKVWKGMAAPVR
jgi:peptidoglycan/xylan/chitin deacetylase (PgdA/CDA1 family)